LTGRGSMNARGAAICYTSGTTGNPKGSVVFSSGNRAERHEHLHAPGCWGLFQSGTRCCRWCRCFTSMGGAPPMDASSPVRSWCCQDRALDGPGLYENDGKTRQGDRECGRAHGMACACCNTSSCNNLKFSSLRRILSGGSAVPARHDRQIRLSFSASNCGRAGE